MGRIKVVAKEVLGVFSEVSESAKSHLAETSSNREFSPFANFDPPERAVNNLRRIVEGNVGNCRILVREPAIARVMVNDDSRNEETYYICRAAPIDMDHDSIKLASYRSPVGRLAALPVGEKHILTLPRGNLIIEVLEHARFQPVVVNQEWDARDSILEGDDYGPVTIKSLRALLKRSKGKQDMKCLSKSVKSVRELLKRSKDEIDPELLDKLLEEEIEIKNVREGLLRSIITKMDLRDQPILDQYQDEIFRLPLDSRLLILGAPGTGKTTTLIRRLGQKLDWEFLDEDEQRVIRSGTFDGKDDYAQNWIMFTPTDLLRLYVKEAFNREGIPASDDRIITWTDFRDDLARSEFGILRSATSSSTFVMKDAARTLKSETTTDQIAWFSDFDQWQKSVFHDEMYHSAQILSENSEIEKIGRRILEILDVSDTSLKIDVFISLTAMIGDIRKLDEKMKESTDNKIRGALNMQVNKDNKFLDNMAAFIEGLSGLNDESDDQDLDGEEDTNQPRIGRRAAADRYMRAVRTHARARARKRSVAKASRDGRLIEWLGERSLAEQDLRDIGESLVVQSALRSFTNPVRRYIDRIPERYRLFRRARQAEDRWYHVEGFKPMDVHPFEVDIILLAMLRGINDLITGAPRLRDPESRARHTLERLQHRYKTQVLVDEAADFSPIQLACMFSLTRPGTRSFFACGDFNQRVTNWGTRSMEEMKWAVPT